MSRAVVMQGDDRRFRPMSPREEAERVAEAQRIEAEKRAELEARRTA